MLTNHVLSRAATKHSEGSLGLLVRRSHTIVKNPQRSAPCQSFYTVSAPSDFVRVTEATVCTSQARTPRSGFSHLQRLEIGRLPQHKV